MIQYIGEKILIDSGVSWQDFWCNISQEHFAWDVKNRPVTSALEEQQMEIRCVSDK